MVERQTLNQEVENSRPTYVLEQDTLTPFNTNIKKWLCSDMTEEILTEMLNPKNKQSASLSKGLEQKKNEQKNHFESSKNGNFVSVSKS